jgi:hypothetical protein
MTGYGGLAGQIDKVVEAAIKADMTLQGWIPTGDGFTFVKGEWDTVTVPGPNGPPTGEVKIGSEMAAGTDAAMSITVNPTEEVYGPWREAITSAFEGWTDLPKPGSYTGPFNAVRAGTELLSGGGDAGTGQASQGGNTHLAGTVLSIVTELAPFSGDTIDAFSRNYVNRLQSVSANQSYLGSALTVALDAEKRVWEEAQASIVRIADEAEPAFEASAHGSGGGGAALTVLGMLATAAAFYFTGGVGAGAVGAASKVIGLLKDAKSLAPKGEEKVPLGGGSPREVLDNLRTAIKKLSDDISTEETRIEDTMTAVLSAATENDGEFNLARPDRFFHENSPTELVTAKNEIALEAKTLTKIGLNYMPFVAGELQKAAGQLNVDGGDAMWSRPANIGLYFTGPSSAVAALSDYLVDVLVETARELRDAGERLDIAARAFTETDGQVHQALAEQSKRLDREQQDRYDAEHPPLPPRPPHMMPSGGMGPI